MFKELYNKTIQLAGHRRSKSILGFISFIESFIFPIPPDVLIIPMTIARKKSGLKLLYRNYRICFGSMPWIFYWICIF